MVKFMDVFMNAIMFVVGLMILSVVVGLPTLAIITVKETKKNYDTLSAQYEIPVDSERWFWMSESERAAVLLIENAPDQTLLELAQ